MHRYLHHKPTEAASVPSLIYLLASCQQPRPPDAFPHGLKPLMQLQPLMPSYMRAANVYTSYVCAPGCCLLGVQVYVDCTLGAGGHMAAMVQQHPVSLAVRHFVCCSATSAAMTCAEAWQVVL
jgi:hypothetical protein